MGLEQTILVTIIYNFYTWAKEFYGERLTFITHNEEDEQSLQLCDYQELSNKKLVIQEPLNDQNYQEIDNCCKKLRSAILAVDQGSSKAGPKEEIKVNPEANNLSKLIMAESKDNRKESNEKNDISCNIKKIVKLTFSSVESPSRLLVDLNTLEAKNNSLLNDENEVVFINTDSIEEGVSDTPNTEKDAVKPENVPDSKVGRNSENELKPIGTVHQDLQVNVNHIDTVKSQITEEEAVVQEQEVQFMTFAERRIFFAKQIQLEKELVARDTIRVKGNY